MTKKNHENPITNSTGRAPVSARSKNSSTPRDSFVKVTLDLSHFQGKLPDRLLDELSAVFRFRDGETHTELRVLVRVLKIYCDYATEKKHESIRDISRETLVDFYERLRREFPQSEYPKVLFNTFRRAIREHRQDLVWPIIGRLNCDPVEAHTPFAFHAIVGALRTEIDRIREKIGRLDNDLKIGRIIDVDTSNFSCSKQPHVYGITAPDIIRTINHYIPDWPMVGRYSELGYRLYDQDERLIEIHKNLQDAEAACKKKSLHYITGESPIQRINNPGEWILYQVAQGSNYYKIGRHINSLFGDTASLADRYYPTSYDLTCVLLYWACLTGWNLETIRSSTIDDLNLRFGNSNCMELLSSEHYVMTGIKRRGQSEAKPKIYTHISDRNNKYGLYSVIDDYYKLTIPIRKHLSLNKQLCVLVSISKSLNQMVVFGSGTKSSKQSPLSIQNEQLAHFFRNHEIYEDQGKKNRLTTTTSQRIRTTYESVLEENNIPLYIRRYFLGHKNQQTTTEYGSEIVSFGIRKRKLRQHLDNLSDDWRTSMTFQGAIIPSPSKKKKTPKRDGNLIQLFHSHLDTPVTACVDRYNPTWHGHSQRAKGTEPCDAFHECLFCRSCRVSRETLPYLYRWLSDLNSWRKEVGGADFDLRMNQYDQAINEVLALWGNEQGDSELIAAEAQALDPDFHAPPLWFRS